MRRMLIGLLGAGALLGLYAGGYYSLFNSFTAAQTVAGLVYDGAVFARGGFSLVALVGL